MKKYITILIIGLAAYSHGAFFSKKKPSTSAATFHSAADCEKNCTSATCLDVPRQLACAQNCRKFEKIDLKGCFNADSAPKTSDEANSKGNFLLRQLIDEEEEKSKISVKYYLGDMTVPQKANGEPVSEGDLGALKRTIAVLTNSCSKIISSYKSGLSSLRNTLEKSNQKFSQKQIEDQDYKLNQIKDAHNKAVKALGSLSLVDSEGQKHTNGQIRKNADAIHLNLKTCFNQGSTAVFNMTEAFSPEIKNRNQPVYNHGEKKKGASLKFAGRAIKSLGIGRISCTKNCQSAKLCTDVKLQKWCLSNCGHKSGTQNPQKAGEKKQPNQQWDWQKIWDNHCRLELPPLFTPKQPKIIS